MGSLNELIPQSTLLVIQIDSLPFKITGKINELKFLIGLGHNSTNEVQ